MKVSRIIIWIGFLAITFIFFYYGRCFKQTDVPGIVYFEFANAAEGKALLQSWETAGLLSIAKKMIWIDFAYIIFYVAIIITLSGRQIRYEPSISLNALLRANFLFAVLAGLFDVAENISLLYNLQCWKTNYMQLSWATWLKFILVAWTFLVWLISFVKSKMK